MYKIIYSGFGTLIDSIIAICSSAPDCNSEFMEQIVPGSDELDHLLKSADLLLLGPLTTDTIIQTRKANNKHPLLSILILPFPEQLAAIKQSILFSPNINGNVSCIPYRPDEGIIALLQSAAQKTRQRKSFQTIHENNIGGHIKSWPGTPSINHTESLMEALPVGVIIYDQNKVIKNANGRAGELFDKPLNSGKEIFLNDLVPSDLTNTGNEKEPELVDINGKFLEVIRTSLNNTPAGTLNMLIISDVTEKTQAIQKLNIKINELELANQDLEQFINVVSHDFKTPITSISLLSELLGREGAESKRIEFAKKIYQSSKHLKDLLEGLVLLIDTKKAEHDKVKELKFEDELLFIMTEYKDLLESSNARVDYDFSDAPSIRYLEAHLKSLISNLISNCIKYRNYNKPLHILIKSRREKSYTILTVKDNGIGIDLMKNMDKLYHPFKRFTNQASGTGLGLSLIKRMIERNGGYLEVSSVVGEGTEFIIFLKGYEG